MSGGVDSSVSAALLKEDKPNNFEKLFGRPTPKGFRGYDVTGVFIKTWSPDWLPRLTGGQACTWQDERRDAMRVSAKLKIPLITLDLEKEYKEQVVDYMIAEYRAGRVPNPDVMCNKVIKFGGFFDFAMKNGVDFVATGHYSKVAVSVERLANSSLNPKRFTLYAGADAQKDQTYFLWTLTQRELAKTLFPIGNLEKSEVRKLAKKFDLPNAEKKDSQGLCFMGKIDVKEFLKHYIKEKPGKVLNEASEIIGEHEGATFYTLGERHGFKITKKGSNDLPYYIVGKDIAKNILIVSDKKYEGEILKKEIQIEKVNWNQGEEPSLKKKFQARIRYRQELENCKIEKVAKDSYKIIFDKGQTAPASGQSVVIYDKDVCLGGGIIERIFHTKKSD